MAAFGRRMSLSQRVVSGLEFGEFDMLGAAVLGELLGLCNELGRSALGLGLGQFELLCQRLELELWGVGDNKHLEVGKNAPWSKSLKT